MSAPRRSLPWALLLPGAAGVGLLALLALQEPTPELPLEVEPVPDRYVELLVPQSSGEADTAAEQKPAPDQPRSARRSSRRAARAVKEEGKLTELGGLIGAKGRQVGAGGLGSRGVGFGGGGTADGLGGLASKGRGSGASGYGGGPRGGGGKGNAVALRGLRGAALEGQLALLAPDQGEGAQSDKNTDLDELFARQQRGEPLPLTATATDPLSTFAADVDTGSYTLARRALREGSLPEPSTVRVEEFINYWRYDYGQPAGGAPVTAESELLPHPDHPGRHLLRVGVQARTVDAADRKPVRLTFLVDVSGSMRGPDRLGLVQQALHHAVDRLGPEDTVAIVTYAGRTEVLASPTPMSRRATLHRAIERLSSGGGTAMGAGVELAYAQAEASYVHGAENRVIVLSDGDANIGAADPESILGTIRRHAEGGITLTTMGFGRGNYKDAMMERLADAGDGAYVYVDGLDEAQRVLGTELGATLETVARDLKIQVELDPAAVRGWRQIGYVNRQIADRDFRNDAVDAGEVGSSHQVTALYELELAPDWQHRDAVGTVRLRAKPPGPDRPAEEWTAPLTGALAGAPSPDSRLALTAMHLADGLHSRRRAPIQAALAEARALEAQGRTGAGELAELCAQALTLLPPAGLAQAGG